MTATTTGWLKLGALLAILGGAYAVVSWHDVGELLKPEQVGVHLKLGQLDSAIGHIG